MKRGDRIVRDLEKQVAAAIEEHGPLVVVNALTGALDDLDEEAGGVLLKNRRRRSGRPSSLGVETLEELQVARREDRKRREQEIGPAIRRGRTPAIVTRSPSDD